MRAPLTLCFTAVAGCGLAIDCGGTFSTEAGQTANGGSAADAGVPSTGGSRAGAGGLATGGAAGSGGAPASGGVATGGETGSGGAPSTDAGIPEPIDIELSILDDGDDATWIDGNDERLSYATDQPFDEVGADAEMGRAGFRFELPIPPNSVIESAVLRLNRIDGTALETETTMVQVYDSVSVPPFDEEHVHAPSEHVPEGLWPVLVSGFEVGAGGSQVQSPDLAVLVQHVIDLPGWVSDSSIAFVLSPETLSTWVGFADSTSGAGGARLRVTYTPPYR